MFVSSKISNYCALTDGFLGEFAYSFAPCMAFKERRVNCAFRLLRLLLVQVHLLDGESFA